MPWGAVAGAVATYALNDSGSNSGSVNTSQSNAPWDGVAPYLGALYKKAYHQAVQIDPALTRGAQGVAGATIRGDYLNPSSNPYLSQYVTDALGQAKSAFAGQYGGQAGQNLGNSGYQEMLMRTLGNTALPIYANAYNQERQNQLNAAQLAPSLDVAPLEKYKVINGILNGGTGFSSSTGTQPYFTNQAANVLGGGILGNQLYQSYQNNKKPTADLDFSAGYY